MDITNKIHVIGLGETGPKDMNSKTLEIIHRAGLLAGGVRHLSHFPTHSGEKFVIAGNLPKLISRLRQGIQNGEQIVVLASGDPLLHGIGSYLTKHFPRDILDIHPYLSSMQLAFAAAGLSWGRASFVSVHGRSLECIIRAVRSSSLVGIFTEDGETPSKVAEYLLEHHITDFDAIVAERLGSPYQKIHMHSLKELAGKRFESLNVLILQKSDISETSIPSIESDIGPGIPEDRFFKSGGIRGLITKAEVRILSIAKMRLTSQSIVWDIGAGAGSISIEAGQIATKGRIYAIEKNPDRIADLEANARQFSVQNIIPVHGEAPDALDAISDDPDAIFIGGSGGRISDILMKSLSRVKPDGRILLTFSTVENLSRAVHVLRGSSHPYEVIHIQISRGREIGGSLGFEALNPVTLVTVFKSGNRR